MQIAILILVVALAATGEASFLSRDVLPVGLSTTFGILPGSSFFSLPLTIQEAKDQEWIETPQPDDVPEIYKELVMYCYECDGPICLLYEQHSGYVAALQIGIDQATLSNNPYDLLENGYQLWTWTCDGVERTNYIIRQYFMTQKFLSKSSAERKSSYDTSKILQDDVVVTMGPGGELMETSSDGTVMRTTSNYKQQSCIYWMGTHYYYNMSKTTECTAQGIYPWFTLIHGDDGYRQDTIGCAMMTFGKVSKQAGKRQWFENPDVTAVKAIVRDGPDCLYKYAEENGVITMHVYFVKSPRNIFC